MANQKNLNLKIDEHIAKGTHGTDVMLTVTDKDACLTFFVLANPEQGEAIATARVFVPLLTAFQLSEMLKKQLGPRYELYQDLLKKLPPTSDNSTSENA